MMLLSALDPALLIYQYEDLQREEWHCLMRLEALTLHRGVIRRYGQKMAMCCELAAVVQESFPWNRAYRRIPVLRDLWGFIWTDLQQALWIPTKVAGEVRLEPEGIVCEYVEAPEAIDAWKGLLCGCLDDQFLDQFDPQIATWKTVSLDGHSGAIKVIIYHSEGQGPAEVHELPLVWDDDSWAKQLATLEWWPDLHRCVELHFRTNSGLRTYPGVRDQPIDFECTGPFWKSVDQFCSEPQRRRSFIEALTKMVYGVHDAGLGLELLGDILRFRVTDFWRVHCRKEEDRLVLEEFGPHDIGRKG